jgi:hypothetical protein
MERVSLNALWLLLVLANFIMTLSYFYNAIHGDVWFWPLLYHSKDVSSSECMKDNKIIYFYCSWSTSSLEMTYLEIYGNGLSDWIHQFLVPVLFIHIFSITAWEDIRMGWMAWLMTDKEQTWNITLKEARWCWFLKVRIPERIASVDVCI